MWGGDKHQPLRVPCEGNPLGHHSLTLPLPLPTSSFPPRGRRSHFLNGEELGMLRVSPLPLPSGMAWLQRARWSAGQLSSRRGKSAHPTRGCGICQPTCPQTSAMSYKRLCKNYDASISISTFSDSCIRLVVLMEVGRTSLPQPNTVIINSFEKALVTSSARFFLVPKCHPVGEL